MRIVSQSASLSYSPLLALPAPRIAGLLAAPKIQPPPAPFVYADQRLADLSDKVRAEFDRLLVTLIQTTVGLLIDERTEAEFGIASGTFARQVAALYHSAIIGDPKPAFVSPFAARRQALNDTIDRMAADSILHMAEARERIARELAAMHARENGQ